MVFLKAYILTLFDYWCTIMRNCSINGIGKLNRLFKRQGICIQLPLLCCSVVINGLILKRVFFYQKCILVFKSLNNMVPHYLQKKIKLISIKIILYLRLIIINYIFQDHRQIFLNRHFVHWFANMEWFTYRSNKL